MNKEAGENGLQAICGSGEGIGSFAWHPPLRVPDEHIEPLTKAALAMTGLLSLFLKDRLERGGSGISERATQQFLADLMYANKQARERSQG